MSVCLFLNHVLVYCLQKTPEVNIVWVFCRCTRPLSTGLTFNLYVKDKWRYIIMSNSVVIIIIMMVVVVVVTNMICLLNIIKEFLIIAQCLI